MVFIAPDEKQGLYPGAVEGQWKYIPRTGETQFGTWSFRRSEEMDLGVALGNQNFVAKYDRSDE